MAFRLFPSRSLWAVNPSDLPSERACAVEPRLRGMEGNPAFRAMAFNARMLRRKPSFIALRWASLGMVALVLFALASPRFGRGILNNIGWLSGVLNIFIFWGVFRGRFVKTRRPEEGIGGMAGWKLLTYQQVDDLRQAGFAGEEAALALWAQMAGRGARRNLLASSAAMLLIAGACALYSDEIWSWFGGPKIGFPLVAQFSLAFIAISSFWLGSFAVHEHWALRRAHATARFLRTHQKGLPGGKGCLSAMAAGAAFWAIFALWMIASPLIPKEDAQSATMAAAATIAAGFGSLGCIRARRARRNAGALLAEMTEDIGWLMEHAREALHELPPKETASASRR